ncbi:hypothetical protein LJC06_02745 [Bacteroidales bacterium OttesenSCG-928-I14]|nr:hypothetical protein [Bacteroidales bacterium OttesenSCG-928-I14]
MQIEKQQILDKLIEENAFWSYDMKGDVAVPDEVLIGESLIRLDIPEINKVIKLFGKKKVKQVWLNQLVVQGDYYKDLNRFLSWMYFDIKKPDVYLKSMLTRHYNKLAAI